jgi:hypothetical protein
LAICSVLLVSAAIIGSWHTGVFARQAEISHRCYNIQLLVRAVRSQGATGHIGIIYRIHNTWGDTCTLQGYPGAELLDRQFHSLPTRVHRGNGFIISGNPPQPQVTLDSGHDAYFGLEYEDVPTGNEPCPRAPYLMVTPPNNNLPVVTYSYGGRSQGVITPCGGDITVSPVHATETFK